MIQKPVYHGHAQYPGVEKHFQLYPSVADILAGWAECCMIGDLLFPTQAANRTAMRGRSPLPTCEACGRIMEKPGFMFCTVCDTLH